MKTISIQLNDNQYEWLSGIAAQRGKRIADVIEDLIQTASANGKHAPTAKDTPHAQPVKLGGLFAGQQVTSEEIDASRRELLQRIEDRF